MESFYRALAGPFTWRRRPRSDWQTSTMSLGALPLEMVVHVMTALSAADMAHAAES